MIKNIRKIVILLAVIAVLILIAVFISKVGSKEDNEKQSLSSSNRFQITDFNIQNRTIIKKDNAIYLGNNTKELENNFCDIKIQNTDNGVVIDLNKLWYETYGDDYIQDDYLAQICREITNRLNIKGDSDQIEYAMYKYIKDNYIEVREGEVIEDILTDEINMKLVLEEQTVKLIIRGS